MLGGLITDLYGIEEGGRLRGMELLPVETTVRREKVRTQRQTVLHGIRGALSCLNGVGVSGYEIHMGDTVLREAGEETQAAGPVILSQGNVYGTYLHGIFDAEGAAPAVIQMLAERKGILCDTGEMLSYPQFKETQYEKLAAALRQHLDLELIYRMLRESRI